MPCFGFGVVVYSFCAPIMRPHWPPSGRNSTYQPVQFCRATSVHIPHDTVLYRQRHKIENMFGRLMDCRRIHTRYDRCAHTFMSAICIAATAIFWLLSMSPDPNRNWMMIGGHVTSDAAGAFAEPGAPSLSPIIPIYNASPHAHQAAQIDSCHHFASNKIDCA
jgi:hypothetical protein